MRTQATSSTPRLTSHARRLLIALFVLALTSTAWLSQAFSSTPSQPGTRPPIVRPLSGHGPLRAQVVRNKPNGRILRILNSMGAVVGFYKETPMHAATPHHDIFDSPMMNVYAHNLGSHFGFRRIRMAHSDYLDEGIDVDLDGQVIRLAPGLYQEAFVDMLDPVAAARRRFGLGPDALPTTDQVNSVIHEHLDLAHTYFALRTLLRGADMNIENFAWSSTGELLSFDNGDILLPSHVLREMGVPDAQHNMYNMPRAPGIRQPWSFDVRQTLPEFRQALMAMAGTTPEGVAAILGLPETWTSGVRRSPQAAAASVNNMARALLVQ